MKRIWNGLGALVLGVQMIGAVIFLAAIALTPVWLVVRALSGH